MMNICKAMDQDLDAVLALLSKVNLPIEGVADHFQNFLVAWDESQLVGCAGIEIYDDVGLIRSVAVHPSLQGQGIGHALIEEIESLSRDKGLKEIYLITDTAEQFFSELSFVTIPREDANPKIKQSLEFTVLCAKCGVCMVKTLK